MLPALAIMGVSAGASLLLAADPNADQEIDLEVPIEGLTRKQWVELVRVLSNGNPRTITPTFRLGVFELTVRRLCDLEAMTRPVWVRHKGRMVWDAQWVSPGSLREFLETPMVQYRLLSESLRRYAETEELRSMVGSTVDDKIATLSGILAVAHRAGLPGLTAWMTNKKVPGTKANNRTRFSVTTADYFARANGLF